MWTEIPTFESSSVIYIATTYTSSMQEFVMQSNATEIRKVLLSMQDEHLVCRI